jgi:hypothetical protein
MMSLDTFPDFEFASNDAKGQVPPEGELRSCLVGIQKASLDYYFGPQQPASENPRQNNDGEH